MPPDNDPSFEAWLKSIICDCMHSAGDHFEYDNENVCGEKFGCRCMKSQTRVIYDFLKYGGSYDRR